MIRPYHAFLYGAFAAAIAALLHHLMIFGPLDARLFAALGLPFGAFKTPDWISYLVMCVVGVGAAIVARNIARSTTLLLFIVVVIVELFGATAVLSLFKIEFAPFGGIVALLLGTFFVTLHAASGPAKRYQELLLAMHGRLSPASLKALDQQGGLAKFQSGPLALTSVCCRAQNTKVLVEALSHENLATALRNVIGRSVDTARDAGAFAEWSDMCGFNALFGLLPSDTSSSVQASKFLLQLVGNLQEWNAECARLTGHMIDLRIGAESGQVAFVQESAPKGVVRAAGDVLLAAERICHANLEYGSTLAVGPQCHDEAAADIEVRPLDFLPAGDFQPAMELYELISTSGSLSDDKIARRDAYWRGVIFFREKRYPEAIASFEEASVPGSNDGPLNWYLRRAIQAENAAYESTLETAI